jgi:hypothetical protein
MVFFRESEEGQALGSLLPVNGYVKKKLQIKIESIRLKNFKAFQNVEIRDLPQFCVLLVPMEQEKALFLVYSNF